MKTLNDSVKEYTALLRNGNIQKAYKGIMTFMSGLKNRMESKYPEYKTSALYFGYMDMTYFAFTPEELRTRSLKVAVVYLHEENRFEAWLGGGNRKIQTDYIERLRSRDIGDYRLSKVSPGVDSILEIIILSDPDFDHFEEEMNRIETGTMEFVKNILRILENAG